VCPFNLGKSGTWSLGGPECGSVADLQSSWILMCTMYRYGAENVYHSIDDKYRSCGLEMGLELKCNQQFLQILQQ
jgi:hypothetical protein